MSRTYSRLLMHSLVSDSTEGVFVVDQVVPAGHTWVVRHIAVTADLDVLLAWRAAILGPDIPALYGRIEVPFASGLAAAQLRTSEWEGRAVVPPGYTLRFQNMAQTGANNGTGQALMSGYDLID